MKKYFDITPEISPDLAVFEGDVPYSRDVSFDMQKGQHMTLSSIRTTLHLGAHADGPNHYSANGVSIGERDLSIYRGRAQVVHIGVSPRELVRPEHFKNIKVSAERILIATGTYPDPNQWRDDFAAFSPELIEWLATKHKVILVGIDTPSVDLSDSKTLDTHKVIAKHDIAILEGLVLKNVPGGVYELIALPLRLRDAEASPVRAVLYQI